MTFLRQDSFYKDLMVWFLVSVILASLFAAGLSALTDQYFGRAIAGIIGDSGQYDLLFEVRKDLKNASLKQVKQTVAEHFPGALIHEGVSIANKSTFFITFPTRFRTKNTFSNLEYYFGNLPGGAGYTIMTEPRLTVTGIPGGVYDQIIREFEAVRGVRFAFQDGNCIEVFLQKAGDSPAVTAGVRQVLRGYQTLEVRFPADFKSQDTVAMGKNLTQALAGKDGIRYIRDVTMGDQSDDYQALLSTLSEMKRFLLAYAGQVVIHPLPGVKLNVGDRLAMAGGYQGPIRPGMLLRPEQVVVKVMSVQPQIKGIIIQGDGSQIKEDNAYLLQIGDKMGRIGATTTVDSQKDQLMHALDQGVILLSHAKNSALDLVGTSDRAKQTVAAASNIRSSIIKAQSMLDRTRKSMKTLTSAETQRRLNSLASVLSGIGGDLQYLSKNLTRVRVVEGRLQKAVSSVRSVQYLMNLGLVKMPGASGDINGRVDGLGQNLDQAITSLDERAQTMDDFINRFNPLVSVLLSWQNKANQVAQEIHHFSGMINQGQTSDMLAQMTGVTQDTLQAIDSLDFTSINQDLTRTSQQLLALNKIDMNAIINQMEQVRSSLPRLMDDELGRSVELIDRYLAGEVVPGEYIQLFTNSGTDLKTLQSDVRKELQSPGVSVSVLPAGNIELNIRGEVVQILREVRGVIAALAVFILFILFFLLDQSAVMAVLKREELVASEMAPGGSGHHRGRGLWGWLPGYLYSIILGGVWMTLTFLISGAKIPYLPWPFLTLIGGLLGLAAFALADRIYQLDMDEVMAGQSLGLSLTAIMREIVVPSGRPGLMQIMNARRMVMRG